MTIGIDADTAQYLAENEQTIREALTVNIWKGEPKFRRYTQKPERCERCGRGASGLRERGKYSHGLRGWQCVHCNALHPKEVA